MRLDSTGTERRLPKEPPRGAPLFFQSGTARVHRPAAPRFVAKSEYEAWFLAAAESVVTGAPAAPADPEAIQGAKEWIRRHQNYRPTVDQASMTARLDVEQARRNAPSFDKLWRSMEALLEA